MKLLRLILAIALALVPLPNVNAAGWLPLAKSAAIAYQGPGNLVTGPTAWWGLRAYTAALRGTKVANICNSTGGTDVGCADYNSDAVTGIIESKVVSGITCPGANCTVKILYDQSGSLQCAAAACDASQTTIANRPLLVASCIGSLPCMTFNGSQTLTTPGVNYPTVALPITISSVVNRTGGVGTLLTYYNGQTNFEIGFAIAANTVTIYNGSTASATANDNTFHAIQSTMNGTTSEIYVDGSANAVNAGSSGAGEATVVTLGGGAFGNAIFSGNEFGTWPSALSSGNKSSLNSNQHTVWGF